MSVLSIWLSFLSSTNKSALFVTVFIVLAYSKFGFKFSKYASFGFSYFIIYEFIIPVVPLVYTKDISTFDLFIGLSAFMFSTLAL